MITYKKQVESTRKHLQPLKRKTAILVVITSHQPIKLSIISVYWFEIHLIKSSVKTKSVDKTRPVKAGSRGGEVCPPLLFWVAKKKGETKEKRSFKVKRLSPRSQYYWFSHSGASIIQNIFLKADHGSRQYFSVFYALPFEIHFTGPAKFKFWTNTFKKCFWKIRIPESLLHGKFELFKHYLVTCTRKWSFPKGEGDLRFW